MMQEILRVLKKHLGQDVVVTRDKDTILQAEGVILPGVGAFGDAMKKLEDYDLVNTIYKVVEAKTPFLGICLGLQLMFEESEETPGVKGLGLLKGKIVRIPDGEGLKIPHIGWNNLSYPNAGRLYKDIPEDSFVYFVHSYYLQAEEPEIVKATTEYGVTIHASVEKENVFVIPVENEEDLSPSFLKKCHNDYRPKRIIIEFNGTWSMSGFIDRGMPRDWELAQMITMADAGTFEVYMSNMRQMMAEQINFTELVIFNRCTADTKRNTFRKAVRALNRRAQVLFESEDGEDGFDDEIDLPYDLNAEVIEIEDDDYGIFYLDALDQPNKYDGKTVKFTAMVYKGRELPKGYFVPGRFAMTCCADDIGFVGMLCKGPQADAFKLSDWVKVTAKISVEYQREYNGEGPVLELIDMVHTAKPKEHLIYMN